MTKTIYLATALLIVSASAFAQKVANYSSGKRGIAAYEHFSFWTKGSKRVEIIYSYGKNDKTQPAQYLGKTTYQGKPGFKVGLPGNYQLYVIPEGINLRVIGPTKKYNKLFAWEYEGPVNGIGTFCDVCADDEKAAMQLVKAYFIH
ncbi:hypothetical protein [Mucilaginibacter sp. PAMB04168]|uniref:hypothetical protein n=1 Tax=Mucilaginibacter sp. PAMB04168 TaxID=3138567 RepID=UPI0031F6A082